MCCADTAQAYVEAHASWSETDTRPTLKRDYSPFVAEGETGAAASSSRSRACAARPA